jgi:putative ABC transport system substrate-binding protein
VRELDQSERLIGDFAAGGNGALILLPDAFTVVNRAAFIGMAARHQLPAIYTFRYFATEGGLIYYGVDSVDLYRRAASYVDRILKGADPAELPVQQPTKFEFIVNLRTAKALGLEVPPTILARADEVIE